MDEVAALIEAGNRIFANQTSEPLPPLVVQWLRETKSECVRARFSGGYDSGSVAVPLVVTCADAKILSTDLPDFISRRLEIALWDVLSRRFGSFAGSFSTRGTVTIFKSGKATVTGRISYYELLPVTIPLTQVVSREQMEQLVDSMLQNGVRALVASWDGHWQKSSQFDLNLIPKSDAAAERHVRKLVRPVVRQVIQHGRHKHKSLVQMELAVTLDATMLCEQRVQFVFEQENHRAVRERMSVVVK